jgi:hypothetical protein
MQHFYDAQIRRYLTQTIRVLSNFVVKYGDGTLHRVPVLYGDSDRQVANIIKQNSENKVNSVPRISVYISGLSLDKERLADATYIGKVHIRERDMNNGSYTNTQGRNYTVERVMPTPFKLSMKVDIWSASTDQKLQLMEQLLVLFNPNLELQTTDNYIDWTSLTLLALNDISWSSRQVPVGNDSPIDIATITLDTPIWISPPVKVKHLGVITKIITSLYGSTDTSPVGYIDGLGVDTADTGTTTMSDLLATEITTITDYNIQVFNNQVLLLGPSESVVPREPSLDIGIRQGTPINWKDILDRYPGQYVAGSSRIFLTQQSGYQLVGTISLDPMDNTILGVNWDVDSLYPDTLIDSNGFIDGDIGFDQSIARSKIDAIVNPLTFNPLETYDGYDNIPLKLRLIIIEDIGNFINDDGADAWKSTTEDDFVAHTNDIIEWDGSKWNVIFDSEQESDTLIWQTNIYTGIQYLWNGVSWVKSFEGEYKKGQWRLEL